METTVRKVEGKYLTFRLGQEEYGVEILKVREIVAMMDITAVPMTAPHIRGVVNLRGKIIPVVDMRRKFDLPEAALARETCIITVMVQGPEGAVLTGLMVDAVREVAQVAAEEVEPIPALGDDMKLDFVTGLSKTKGRVIVLLDIDKALQGQDLKAIQNLQTTETGAAAPTKKEA